MRLKRIQIGPVETENNVFLAPLAGYTNYPFRKIALESGAGFVFTEMVSAKGLCYGSENTKELLYTAENERGAVYDRARNAARGAAFRERARRSARGLRERRARALSRGRHQHGLSRAENL